MTDRIARPKREWGVIAEPAFWVMLLLALALFAVLSRPLAVGDGLAYLIWLDSIALDGDLDLSNQAEKFATVNTYHIYLNPNTGRWASAFPFGIALLLTPFYWLGALLDVLPAFRVNDAHFLGIQGVPYAYSLCAMIGVNLYALLTLSLGYRIARGSFPVIAVRCSPAASAATKQSPSGTSGDCFVAAAPRNDRAGGGWGLGPWAAAAATLATLVGTPLLFYSTVDPINSHVAGAFATTLVLWLWLRARDCSPARHWKQALPWLWVGLAVGLTAVSRWQVALIAAPIGVELLCRQGRHRQGRHRRWREVALLVIGFCLLAWLIPYGWWRMYGKLALIPSAEGDQNLAIVAPVHTLRVLFSPISGLFPWSPLAALALLGLWPLARRDRSLAASLLAMFVLQALVNGAVADWWAGVGFGMRRMAELYPVYLLCLAALLGMTRTEEGATAAAGMETRPTRWRLLGTGTRFGNRGYGWARALVGVAWIATAVCAAYGLALVVARMSFTWTNPWGLARDTPLKELRYAFAPDKRYLIWPVIKDHVGFWAWKKPGP